MYMHGVGTHSLASWGEASSAVDGYSREHPGNHRLQASNQNVMLVNVRSSSILQQHVKIVWPRHPGLKSVRLGCYM
jgi:hypothetical protein